MPGGIQRQANLRSLYERACQYEQTNFRGLFRFLRFIERLQKNGNDLGTARAMGENEDVVRIMSIHRSKGLEFPVVFIADMGKRFNTIDLTQSALFHKELGIGPDVVHPEQRIRYPSLAKRALFHRLKRETLSEELRILYVALTRARKRLILVGSVKKVERSLQTWRDWQNFDKPVFPDWFLADAKSWLDWLGPALARHPQGQPIRNINIGEQALLSGLDANSAWNIYTWNSSTLGELRNEPTTHLEKIWNRIENLQSVNDSYSFTYRELVDQRLNWTYAYSKVLGCPAKWSVSELKSDGTIINHQESKPMLERVIFHRPRFLQQQSGLSSVERGSVIHLVMQHLFIEQPLDYLEIQTQIGQMVQKQILTPEQAEAADIAKIEAFYCSALGKRLCNAKNVYRELPFGMSIDAGRLYPDVKNETVFIQGIIDCIFEEEQGLILLDYKTDHLGSRIDEKRMSSYQKQLQFYREAVETILKQPVVETFLYFTATGDTIQVPINASI
jgi:ATP-dependent helicase/nuclease subunit A